MYFSVTLFVRKIFLLTDNVPTEKYTYYKCSAWGNLPKVNTSM